MTILSAGRYYLNDGSSFDAAVVRTWHGEPELLVIVDDDHFRHATARPDGFPEDTTYRRR